MAGKVITNLGQELTLKLTGVTLFMTFYLKNNDEDRTPFNLASCSIASEIRATANGAVLASLVPVITNAALGEFTLELTDAAASALTFESAVWDVILTDSVGRTHQLARGKVLYQPEITQ